MRSERGEGGSDLFREGWVGLQRWLARAVAAAAGGSEEAEAEWGARCKAEGGGRWRERSWFSSEVTYLEANLIHSPKRTGVWSNVRLRIGQSRHTSRTGSWDPGIHRTLPGRDRWKAQFWSSLPYGYDPSCRIQSGEVLLVEGKVNWRR